MKTTLEVCALIVLLLCFAAILVSSVFLVRNNSQQSVVKHEIHLSVNTDSTKIISNDIYAIVDSLRTHIQITEQRIADKYEYFLEQKREENILFSIGSLLIGVFISIVGFFGYKSFKDIENHAKEQAENIASNTAKEQAKNVASNTAKEYLKDNLPQFIDEGLTKITVSLNNTIRQMVQENVNSKLSHSLENITEDVELLKMYVNEQNNSNTPNIENNEAEQLFND